MDKKKYVRLTVYSYLTTNELFNKSFFSTYDDVFEEGTPLSGSKQMLNVSLNDLLMFRLETLKYSGLGMRMLMRL